jgi:hypothetical protein
MLLIREVFHCKPGKVRPLLEIMRKMSDLGAKSGMPPMRLLTDFAAERYWTLVAEMEVASLADFERMMKGEGMSEADNKEFEAVSKGYHDFIEDGRREIFRIE